MAHKTAVITGGARRIGAAIARHLHQRGYRLWLHYRHSRSEAEALQHSLNQQRPGSVELLEGSLDSWSDSAALADTLLQRCERIDALINNASSFFPTPLGEISEAHWQTLLGSNLQAPLVLAQALAPRLAEQQGSIVNIVDIYGERPLKQHSLYCVAKAGLGMLTQSLALELAPRIRVNGIAPGAILWPSSEEQFSPELLQAIAEKVPLQQPGQPRDIARAVYFLLEEAPYISGHILPVDGGRRLGI